MDMHQRERVVVQEAHHVAVSLYVELFCREHHLPAGFCPQHRGDADSQGARQLEPVSFSRYREKDGVELLDLAVFLGDVQLEFRPQAVGACLLLGAFHRTFAGACGATASGAACQKEGSKKNEYEC